MLRLLVKESAASNGIALMVYIYLVLSCMLNSYWYDVLKYDPCPSTTMAGAVYKVSSFHFYFTNLAIYKTILDLLVGAID